MCLYAQMPSPHSDCWAVKLQGISGTVTNCLSTSGLAVTTKDVNQFKAGETYRLTIGKEREEIS